MQLSAAHSNNAAAFTATDPPPTDAAAYLGHQAAGLFSSVQAARRAAVVATFRLKRDADPGAGAPATDTAPQAKPAWLASPERAPISPDAVPPGFKAVINIVAKWVNEGRHTDIVRAIGRSDFNDGRYERFMEAIVADLKQGGQYDSLADAALDRFKRDGLYGAKLDQLRGDYPDRDTATLEKIARAAFVQWETLDTDQKASLFALLLDPDCPSQEQASESPTLAS